MIYFETEFPVRYYEADPMGIVHHSNYIRYFECARDELIASFGYGIEKCAEDGLVFPVVRLECRYRHPARIGDVLRVSACIEELPGAKLDVVQKVFNQKGELCAEGIVTLAFMDASTGRVMRCPEKFLKLLEEHINDK